MIIGQSSLTLPFVFRRLFLFVAAAAGSVGFTVAPLHGVAFVDVTTPTTDWRVIAYSNNNPDPSSDQQTGSAESDIVGNAAHPAAYTMFGDAGTPSKTDGTLGFRIRVGEDANPAGFKGALLVGIDANLDGALDVFMGVNNAGQNDTLGLWSPGTGANVSPSTTTVGSTPLASQTLTTTNYNFTPVTTINDPSVGTALDLDGTGKNDYFLTFTMPFADLVAALATRGITGFTQETPLSYVISTSTQGNSLNQDLNGVGKTYDDALTYSALGVSTTPLSADGAIAPVPEPTTVITGALLVCVAGWQARGALRLQLRRLRLGSRF